MRIEHATLSAAAGEPQPVVAEVPKYLCSSSTADAAARQAIHFVTWEKLHGMRCQTRLTEKERGEANGGGEESLPPGKRVRVRNM